MSHRHFIGRTRYPFLISLFCAFQLVPVASDAATLAGKEVRGGGTLDLQFPISNYFQENAAQGGNPRPATGRALLMFPKGFDPGRSWPILIVTSTSDNDRASPMDAPRYQDAAMKEGWIVLATDATIRPRVDSVSWRLAILTAGLLGDNYVAITPMYNKTYLQSGSVIQETHSAMILEKLIGEFLFNVKNPDNKPKSGKSQ